MSTYEVLDNLILSAVKERKSPIYEREVNREAGLLADEMGREAFRVIDCRLTALKKAGRIVHRTKAQANGQGGWHLVGERA